MPACPACGEDNPARARFCWSCGTALASPAPQAEERKVVSILFVDLVGFTGRSDGADPEDVRARLRPYHRRMRQEIERFGGTVEKFVGDAVMAVFGAPRAHEDDPERAVRAALRILEAIDELNAEHPGLDLAVRAAVNTGEAVVSLDARPAQGEGIATGDVVNTAARLQGAAPVGAVVVGAGTWRATRDVFEWEELEPISAKGKAEPVPLWRALRARMRFGIDLDTGPRVPFVGRDDDLALLRATYERTLRESSVQLVTVTGEPGVGKTRLVGEFRDWVDAREEIVYWRQGRCLPYGEGITYWALGEMVKAHAGMLETDTRDEVEEKLRSVVGRSGAELDDREWIVARLRPLVGLDAAAGSREESFTAWQRFLEAAAERRPLVLVFEDLHWADEALAAFIDHLVDWSSGVPLLVVCTARPELYERHPDWGGGKRNSTTIGLSPLTSTETARLLASLLERSVLPAETQAALLERSGGNPLYAEEFVRMLGDRDLLGAAADVPVPDTVQALIAARLDTLPPERKALLHDAAVVGKVFWAGAVAAMGARDAGLVRAGLHELSRKELVRPARTSSVRDEAEYAFWHALVRDVAYGQIPRAARSRKHRAAAEWIEQMAGERVADHAELLAHHYGQALELARAAGETADADALLEPTRRFLTLAAQRAMRLDVVAGRAYYDRALVLYDPDDLERARLLLRKNLATYRVEGSLADLAEAERIFRLHADDLGLGATLNQRSKVEWIRGRGAEAEALISEAVVLLERHPPSLELADVYGRQAGRAMIAGRSRECIEWVDRAIAIWRELGHEQDAAGSWNMRGCARCELDDPEGLDELRGSLAALLESGRPDNTHTAYVNVADWTWALEGPERGLAVHREAEEFCRRRGLVAQRVWCRAESTWMLYDLGRWDELLEIAEDVERFDESEGPLQQGLLGVPYAGHVRVRRGELSAAAGIRDAYLERAIAADDPQVVATALALHGFVEAAQGNTATALDAIRRLNESTRDRADWHRGRFLPELVRLALRLGRADLARELMEPLHTKFGRTGHAIVAARAELAEGEGRPEEALALHEDAAARWEMYGRVDGRADSLHGAGRCLLALERVGEARDRLAAARSIYEQLVARPSLAEVDALLGDQPASARAAT